MFATRSIASRTRISSAAATIGSPGQYVHYAAAKAAVDAMTVGLSKEVAADGIRVNCVAPGTVWTGFHADPQRPAKVAAAARQGCREHPYGPCRAARGDRRRRLLAPVH